MNNIFSDTYHKTQNSSIKITVTMVHTSKNVVIMMNNIDII